MTYTPHTHTEFPANCDWVVSPKFQKTFFFLIQQGALFTQVIDGRLIGSQLRIEKDSFSTLSALKIQMKLRWHNNETNFFSEQPASQNHTNFWGR